MEARHIDGKLFPDARSQRAWKSFWLHVLRTARGVRCCRLGSPSSSLVSSRRWHSCLVGPPIHLRIAISSSVRDYDPSHNYRTTLGLLLVTQQSTLCRVHCCILVSSELFRTRASAKFLSTEYARHHPFCSLSARWRPKPITYKVPLSKDMIMRAVPRKCPYLGVDVNWAPRTCHKAVTA